MHPLEWGHITFFWTTTKHFISFLKSLISWYFWAVLLKDVYYFDWIQNVYQPLAIIELISIDVMNIYKVSFTWDHVITKSSIMWSVESCDQIHESCDQIHESCDQIHESCDQIHESCNHLKHGSCDDRILCLLEKWIARPLEYLIKGKWRANMSINFSEASTNSNSVTHSCL